jgi:hypothetical protein
MEATKMLQALEALSEQYGGSTSYMQIARDAVLKQLAVKNQVPMPDILDESQRKIFMDNISHISGFVKSEDGADAIEFLMNAYEHYCERMAEAETEAIQEQI